MLNQGTLRAFVIVTMLAPSACGSGSSPTEIKSETTNATTRLNDLSIAYSDNSIKAKRTWGGKRLVFGGELYSTDKNPDGTISLLVTPSAGRMNELRFDPRYADIVVDLNKGDTVTAECTVDPTDESWTGPPLLDCVPGGVKAP